MLASTPLDGLYSQRVTRWRRRVPNLIKQEVHSHPIASVERSPWHRHPRRWLATRPAANNASHHSALGRGATLASVTSQEWSCRESPSLPPWSTGFAVNLPCAGSFYGFARKRR